MQTYGHTYVPVDREADDGQWVAEVYGDPAAAAVTQVTDGRATSSLSCQAVVVDMLDSFSWSRGSGCSNWAPVPDGTQLSSHSGPARARSRVWKWTRDLLAQQA
ncbi:hypothetical protein ACFYXH_35815 [Streptomyces sp. NPDC002730]|uniref:hypothetical protein n=1 Tax=Streptomyces sp. NPDC002730 TaxID=3364662 RepID=UPI0036A14427